METKPSITECAIRPAAEGHSVEMTVVGGMPAYNITLTVLVPLTEHATVQAMTTAALRQAAQGLAALVASLEEDRSPPR